MNCDSKQAISFQQDTCPKSRICGSFDLRGVSYAQRVLPKPLGGLGQLDSDTHLEMMQARWVINMYMAGDSGLWTVYWKEN